MSVVILVSVEGSGVEVGVDVRVAGDNKARGDIIDIR
jgi:hypothetical protein